MTTEVIGTLPCPECNTPTELKSDGRKHTLKCHHCGVLAYYQTQQAKAHIEERLDVQGSANTAGAGAVKEQASSASQTPPANIVQLQLPETSDAQQRYILSLEPMVNIESVDGKPAMFDADLAANDVQGCTNVAGAGCARVTDEHDSEQSDTEKDQAPRGFFDRLGEYL